MADERVVVNVDEAPVEGGEPGPYGAEWRVLTPSMRPRGGRLGVAHNRLKQGQSGCPFHAHLREDEVFYVLSGRGVLRYGERLFDLRPGDTVSCPAGTGLAHQLANPYEEDLVYLAIGPYDPHEVCTYPDTGKIFVRGAKQLGFLAPAEYMDREPDPPVIFALAARSGDDGGPTSG